MRTSSRHRSWASSSSSSSQNGGRRTSRGSGNAVPGYASIWSALNCKIASYKTLCAQTTGPAKFSRPTLATLNSFSKWVEKGAVIHKVSPTQVRRWSKSSSHYTSASSAKNALTHRFGKSTIKAVTRDKSGSFLVACSPTWKGGKKFSFPS